MLIMCAYLCMYEIIKKYVCVHICKYTWMSRYCYEWHGHTWNYIYIFFLVIAMPPLLNIHHIGFQMLHRFCPLEVGAFGRVSPRGGHCFINHNFHMYSKKTNIIYINKYTLIETSVIMMVIDHHQLIALKLGSFLFWVEGSFSSPAAGFSRLLMTKGSLSFVLELIQPSTPEETRPDLQPR